MTPGEEYNLKRQNFIEQTKKNFAFLVSEFGFKDPEHFTSGQANGVIIQDRIEYDRKDKKLTFLNAYHPVDYGFEINLSDKESGQSEMLHFILKENQDVEQSYLKSAADFLKKTYLSKIENKEGK